MFKFITRRIKANKYRKETEDKWRGKGINKPVGWASSNYYHYHATGSPIGFPHHLSLVEFQKLVKETN